MGATRIVEEGRILYDEMSELFGVGHQTQSD